MVKATFAIGMALGAMAAADATKINFVNQCGYNVDLQHVQGGSQIARLSNIAPGTAYAYYANGPAHMFRHGYGDQATLAEFSIPGDGKAWYDISIIPPGPGQCRSYEDCKGATGRKGFNVPMNIAPKQNANGRNCRQLVCPADDKWACADAYHFPADTKTHDCPDWTEFDVVFCPGGPGGNGGGGGGGSCKLQDGVDFTGYDMSNVLSSKAEPCCDICRSTPGCRAFTWSTYNGGTCWLKSGKGAAKYGVPGVTSWEM